MDAAFSGWPVFVRNVGHHQDGVTLLVLTEISGHSIMHFPCP